MPDALASTEKVVGIMRFSEEPCIRKVLSVYDNSSPDDRRLLPIEAFVIKANAPINELLGSLIMTYRATQNQKSALTVMAEHPDVVAKTIEYAKEKTGVQDRRMIHEAVNFIPTPKGQTFNFTLPTAAPPAPLPQKIESIDVESEADINECFPLVHKKQQDWQLSKNLLLKAKD